MSCRGLWWGTLLAPEVGLGPLLMRLGFVAGVVFALVVIVAQGRHLLMAQAPVDSFRADLTALDRHTTKSASSTSLVPAFAAPTGRSPADNAAPDMRTRFDVGFAIQPALNAEYVEAVKLIIPPPPQTELGLQGADPRRLRTNFQRGVTAMRGDVQDQIANGARLVSVAAVLGYKPARTLIAQRYPSSSVIRSAVTSTEAIRYSLDPLVISGAKSEGNRNFLVLLASYFSGRQALQEYATDLLAVLHDDRRLQTDEGLQLLLTLLARVRGACTAIAMTIVKARTVTAPECSPALRLQVQNYVHVQPAPGLEAESRRQALRFLDDALTADHSVARSPAAD
jgi:hypothetical protein